MVRDKISGESRDFAFIEYFSVEEAIYVLDLIKRSPVKIRNNQIFVTFSKIRREEDTKVLKTF